MKKIPTLFERDWNGDRSRVVAQVTKGCEWVQQGKGRATIKLDGMCCAIMGGVLYKRREVKKGKRAPDGFILTEEDQKTGKRVGWLAVGDGPEDQYFREAIADPIQPTGTYELVGPKSQGGIEAMFADRHELVAHGSITPAEEPPTDFAGLKAWLDGQDIEGLVWHGPDGKMAKIKLKDLGLRRTAS